MSIRSPAPPNTQDPQLRLGAVVISANAAPQFIEISEVDYAASSLTLLGKDFNDVGTGEWLGFYDWLRTSEGTLIGLRQWIDDTSKFPFHSEFRGVAANLRRKEVCIFFGQEDKYDDNQSCDQDFGNNRLLASGEDIALTFYLKTDA